LEKDTVVLGASADSQEANRAWSAMYSFPFPLLCDGERVLQKNFGGAVRWAILIDKDRTIQAFCPTVGGVKYTFAEEMLMFIP